MFSLSDTPCQSILPNDGKIATKLWLAMGPFQIMLMSIRQTRSLGSRTNGGLVRWENQPEIWDVLLNDCWFINPLASSAKSPALVSSGDARQLSCLARGGLTCYPRAGHQNSH